MNSSYISFIDNPVGNKRPLRQTSQSSRCNGFYESGMSSYPRSKVDKYKKSSPPEILSATRGTSTLTIPDIRLEPPSEDLITGRVPVFDIYSDIKLKMADILGRLQDESDVTQTTDLVTLPGRYTSRLSGASSGQEQNSSKEEMRNRETDLSTALKWIRQEILYMKQQDTCLLKQFAHLHDSILQLRSLYDTHSSCSDISSLDGSTYSLNEQARSPRLRRLVLDGNHYTNKPSVSLPSSPQVPRFKWGSQDIV